MLTEWRGQRRIADSGPPGAHIVIVGEAGGARERDALKPFVGPAGWKLDAWLGRAQLHRSDCYITNVFPFQPDGNKIESVPRADLDVAIEELHDRLAALDQPYIIVPTGNVPLRALTGRQNAKITEVRGFFESYMDRRGRTIKVIPTIHPARIFREPYYERRCLLDWEKIALEARSPAIDLPAWEHFVAPTIGDLHGFHDDALRRAEVLSIDIETFSGVIDCVGFGYEADFSMTIPTTLRYWSSQAQLDEAWRIVRELCALPCRKAMQYGFFDAYWLLDERCPIVNWDLDCGAMHHAIDAADDHDLGYMASTNLRMPAWKHIPKDDDARARYPSDAYAVRVYNGIDVCVQWQLADLFEKRLAAARRLPFYRSHYVDLFQPLLRLMRHGVATDDAARAARFTELRANCTTLTSELNALAGRDLCGKLASRHKKLGVDPTISNKKLSTYFYDVLKLPKQIKRETGKLTTDEVAIRKIMLAYQRKITAALATGRRSGPDLPLSADVPQFCAVLLEHRRKKKLSEFLDAGRLDRDGRMRSSYGFAPETGRLSSSKNPRGTGSNAQNQDHEVRDIFVPDDGCVFMEVDASQGEDRIVKALIASLLPNGPRRDELLWRARAQPWENDEHRRAACAIFGVIDADVTPAQRFIGKRGRHASNYDQHGKGLSEVLLKDGVTITPEEGQRMIEAVVDRDIPELRDWQCEIRKRLLRDRALTNGWGRELLFTYDRLDEDAYRRGYAFIPQSSLATLLNQWGFVPLDAAIVRGDIRAAINVNNHDSLLVSVRPADVWDVWQFLRSALERPATYWGVELIIPVTLKCGLNWAFNPGKEWKRPPERDELDAYVRSLCDAR